MTEETWTKSDIMRVYAKSDRTITKWLGHPDFPQQTQLNQRPKRYLARQVREWEVTQRNALSRYAETDYSQLSPDSARLLRPTRKQKAAMATDMRLVSDKPMKPAKVRPMSKVEEYEICYQHFKEPNTEQRAPLSPEEKAERAAARKTSKA